MVLVFFVCVVGRRAGGAGRPGSSAKKVRPSSGVGGVDAQRVLANFGAPFQILIPTYGHCSRHYFSNFKFHYVFA